MNNGSKNAKRDLVIIALSVAVAILLVKTNAIETLIASAQKFKFLGSFIAGMFFVSVFTAAPAAVALLQLMETGSLFLVALFGGLGALLGDFLIFNFMRDHAAQDFEEILQKTKLEKIKALFQNRFLRWLLPVIGALIIASPFPDEIGLALLGLSKTKTAIFIPISFLLNFLGILLMGVAVKSFF